MNTLHSSEKRVGTEFRIAISRALEGNGAEYADFCLPQPQLSALHSQAAEVRFGFPRQRPIRRFIKEWPNTERATFVPATRDLLRHPLEVGALPQLWRMSEAAEITRHFAHRIRAAGQELGLPTLTHWSPNRIGINYLYGTPESPAEIGEHTDVENELGLVIAFDVAGGRHTGQPHLILGHDTCKWAGIKQPPHEIVAKEERMGMTIAQLDF